MRQESLEALLIDRALGELTREVSELLQAYLESHPREARQAETWERTWQAAQRATAIEVGAVPPPSRRLWAGKTRRGWLGLRRRELLRVAACLVLGTGLGWILSGGHEAPRGPSGPRADATPLAPSAGEEAGFWSLAYLAVHDPGLAAASERLTRSRLR